MASSADAPRTSSKNAGPSSIHARSPSMVNSVVSQAQSSYLQSHSLKRKKSSDSTGTGAAVTMPEDSYERPQAASRPFITHRRSRPKLEVQRAVSFEKANNVRGEAVRRRTAPAGFHGGLPRRENHSTHTAVDHGRRDKGKAVDRSVPARRPLPEPPSSVVLERSEKYTYSRPLVHAEFERMRIEIETWKKTASENMKQAKRQAKKVEELKAQILAETLAKKEQETRLQTLRAKMEKKEELITNIEQSLQCQICMDLIHRPYALSPCGHILCLNCLQEWFRKAPPSPEDDDVDPEDFQDDLDYILNRYKSCPCCRAVITRRPIPVFVIKAVTSAISKYKATAETGPSACERSVSPDDEDPWRGLFPASDDEGSEGFETGDEDEDEDEDDEVFEDAIGWAMRGLQMGIRGDLGHQLSQVFEGVGSESGSDFEADESGASERHRLLRVFEDVESESDSEVDNALEMEDDEDDEDRESDFYGSDEYESVYVPARWEPPSIDVDPSMYVFRNQGMAASIIRMVRRGCTIDMIRIFEITYSHDQGLVAHLSSLDELCDFARVSDAVPRNSRVFLGWNVNPDGEDYTGKVYMQNVLTDMRVNREQWMWTERLYFPGEFDVKRLVRIEEVEQYDTTDTEDWLAHGP